MGGNNCSQAVRTALVISSAVGLPLTGTVTTARCLGSPTKLHHQPIDRTFQDLAKTVTVASSSNWRSREAMSSVRSFSVGPRAATVPRSFPPCPGSRTTFLTVSGNAANVASVGVVSGSLAVGARAGRGKSATRETGAVGSRAGSGGKNAVQRAFPVTAKIPDEITSRLGARRETRARYSQAKPVKRARWRDRGSRL